MRRIRKPPLPLYWWRTSSWCYDNESGASCTVSEAKGNSNTWIWSVRDIGTGDQLVARGETTNEARARAICKKMIRLKRETGKWVVPKSATVNNVQ